MRKNLKIFRITHSLTQLDMAQLTGVSVSTYNLIEAGKRRGSQGFWERLQSEFDLEDGKVWHLQKLSKI